VIQWLAIKISEWYPFASGRVVNKAILPALHSAGIIGCIKSEETSLRWESKDYRVTLWQYSSRLRWGSFTLGIRNSPLMINLPYLNIQNVDQVTIGSIKYAGMQAFFECVKDSLLSFRWLRENQWIIQDVILN
jgi:hypothetical protein